MKGWAGLLAFFLLAAIGAVSISTRLQPDEWEVRHATIRIGMTPEEVVSIMNTGGLEPQTFLASSGSGFTWSYVPPRRFLTRDVRLEVDFDVNQRVIRTSVNEAQLMP